MTRAWIGILGIGFLAIGCRGNALAPVSGYFQSVEDRVYAETHRGNYEEAIRLIDSQLDRNSDNERFHKLKANVMLMKKKLSWREMQYEADRIHAKNKIDRKDKKSELEVIQQIVGPFSEEKKVFLTEVIENYERAYSSKDASTSKEAVLGAVRVKMMLMLMNMAKEGHNVGRGFEKFLNSSSFTDKEADQLLEVMEQAGDLIGKTLLTDRIKKLTPEEEAKAKKILTPKQFEDLKKGENLNGTISAEAAKIRASAGATTKEKMVEYLKWIKR